MRPAERLRIELEQLRNRDFTFKQAWPVALRVAVGDLGLHEAIWWREAFAEQKTVWMLSYSRAPWPAKKRLGHLFVPDGDHHLRSQHELVA